VDIVPIFNFSRQQYADVLIEPHQTVERVIRQVLGVERTPLLESVADQHFFALEKQAGFLAENGDNFVCRQRNQTLRFLFGAGAFFGLRNYFKPAESSSADKDEKKVAPPDDLVYLPAKAQVMGTVYVSKCLASKAYKRLAEEGDKLDAANPLPPLPISKLIDHIDHIAKVAGLDHVGLGSDFDGVSGATPEGIDSAADLPKITQGLLDRGYSAADIHKILGGNLMRVFRDVERVSREMRAAAAQDGNAVAK